MRGEWFLRLVGWRRMLPHLFEMEALGLDFWKVLFWGTEDLFR